MGHTQIPTASWCSQQHGLGPAHLVAARGPAAAKKAKDSNTGAAGPETSLKPLLLLLLLLAAGGGGVGCCLVQFVAAVAVSRSVAAVLRAETVRRPVKSEPAQHNTAQHGTTQHSTAKRLQDSLQYRQ